MRDAGPGTSPKACIGEDDLVKLKALLDLCHAGLQ